MKYLFVSVGKEHDELFGDAVDEFSRRISRYVSFSWKVLQQSKRGSKDGAEIAMREEGEVILRVLEPGDYIIVLDEHGKELSSVELSELCEKKTNEGIKRMVFVIGGAYGISDAVKQKANFTWSLSRLTFPHQLARLVLTEQTYRALSILANEKYHHE